MRQCSALFCWLACILLPLATICLAHGIQKPAETSAPYTFHIPVDEISLVFHASDAQGKPVTNLTMDELQLTDNDKPQTQVVMLQPLQDLPIRAGFLFDVSASVLKDVAFNRSVIQMYASRLLRKGFDSAFVMQFDTDTLITQNWTDNDGAIAGGAAAIGERSNRLDPLTAIFDSLYITCRDQWAQKRSEETGNFILLFSDGEDDASHAYLSEAVDMCQRAHVAIYVFSNSTAQFSDGNKTLSDLARKTGGRVFVHPRGNKILEDLAIMETEQRFQYRLTYKPSTFVADGSFHRVGLRCSIPRVHIATRSGYYAFARR